MTTETDILLVREFLANGDKLSDAPLAALSRIEDAIYRLRHELEMSEDALVAESDNNAVLANG